MKVWLAVREMLFYVKMFWAIILCSKEEGWSEILKTGAERWFQTYRRVLEMNHQMKKSTIYHPLKIYVGGLTASSIGVKWIKYYHEYYDCQDCMLNPSTFPSPHTFRAITCDCFNTFPRFRCLFFSSFHRVRPECAYAHWINIETMRLGARVRSPVFVCVCDKHLSAHIHVHNTYISSPFSRRRVRDHRISQTRFFVLSSFVFLLSLAPSCAREFVWCVHTSRTLPVHQRVCVCVVLTINSSERAHARALKLIKTVLARTRAACRRRRRRTPKSLQYV